MANSFSRRHLLRKGALLAAGLPFASSLLDMAHASPANSRWVATISLFFSLFLAVPATSGQNADRLAGNADAIVWQLNLMKAPPTDYQLQFTRVARDDKGQPVLEADCRRDKGDWHSCITLPKGLLKAGEDYYVVLDYEIIDQLGEGSYFYIFARSGSLGYGADQWSKWNGYSGARGTAKLRVSPSAGDFQLTAGICKQGAIRIRNLIIFHGNGWSALPLEGTAGGAQAPPPPAGAQPFTVDAPANVKGPVLNLADFGAVADGDSPPSPGPDRNGAALKAAIAKCRETGASKLIVPKGVYRITSGETIVFDSLYDFTFDGGGSTFLFHQIKGGAGMSIKRCNRTIFRNFNMDWDWKIDPLASVGRVLKIGPNSSFFEMRFETTASLDPKRWVTMNPLDEKLRAPGTGQEFGGFNPKQIDSIDPQTVRVWPSRPIAPIVGRLYLLRHYVDPKHCILLTSNTHLSLQYVTVFSFPGIAFLVGGDQHHFELLHCRITYPDNQRRPITTTSDGFHIGQSQGFMRLEDCDFGYMGDDCINIHDNIHSGVRIVDAHTLVATGIIPWTCPYAPDDLVEIRNGDYSPTGYTGKVKESKADYKNKEVTLVFDQELPGRVPSDAILFNHRYGSHNCIIRNCYFHENRARAILCNTADWLIEGNRFFHNQFAAMLLLADVGPSWSEGFGARNVVVRHNRFDSSNSIGASDGAVIDIRATNGGITTRYPLLETILFEDNVFKEMTGPAIEAGSFNNLVIRNNKFINREKAPITLRMRGSIRAESGSGLWVEDNEWTTQKGIDQPSLFYDVETSKKVVSRNNHLAVGLAVGQTTFTNGIGMKFQQIPGNVTFSMGKVTTDPNGVFWDGVPVHQVRISHAYYLGVTEVTNAQYELFQPSHVQGTNKAVSGDTQPAVNVSWTQAEAFVAWLNHHYPSTQPGMSYRLPTEAEWEYAADNAGKYSLDMMQSGAEEWTGDWYGPYPDKAQTDPVGPEKGVFRVSRGNDYNAYPGYSDPTVRMGSLPWDLSPCIGFRVALGPTVSSNLSPSPLVGARASTTPVWAKGVSQKAADFQPPAPSSTPYFSTPEQYFTLPSPLRGPFYGHDHEPALTYCPNGDLLVAFFSCVSETAREMTVLASRLRRGATAWDSLSLFYNTPSRNGTGVGLFNDKGTLYHFQGFAADGGYDNLANCFQTSTDNGVTWSAPRVINSTHGLRNQVISGFRTANGRLIVPCDATPNNGGGTAIHYSDDNGLTWADPGAGLPTPGFVQGGTGHMIAGIHAAVAETIRNGTHVLVAYGRQDNINGMMPLSLSTDGGITWTYSASPFPAISGGQRAICKQLSSGALLLVSFAPSGTAFTNKGGHSYNGNGLFAALSYDGGQTWPIMKLVTDGVTRSLKGYGNTGNFRTGPYSAEPAGYLAGVETPDGLIHVVSSGVYYSFNQAWLEAPYRL
jgi:hypothetical protein